MTRRWRLFPKYALLIIALVAGMVLASGAVSIYFSHRENQDHLVALQDEKAQGAANRIEQYMQGIEHQLSWTALPRIDSSGGGDALEARRIEYLKLLRQVPAITEVVWIDPGGREQLRVSRLAMDTRDSGADISQEPKFVQARGGKTYYGPVYFRKGTEPYLTIARTAGSGGGVTAAEVNLKFVWEVVSRIRIGEKGLAYVIDAGGTLIAHPDISLVLKKTDLHRLPQVAAVVAPDGHAPEAARDLRGEPVLAASARIPTLAWTVFVEAPRAEAYAPLYATLQRMGLVLVVALLISIAASYVLARALVRPLRALQEGAAQIGAGELDRHIEVRTGDELEGLAEQFNKMSADLKESYAGLERKVEERTAELTEALNRQTATAEILRVISASPTSVQPVLEAVAERSALLCHAEGSRVWLAMDGALRAMTSYGPAYGNPAGWTPSLPLSATSPVGRAFLERRAVHVEDVKPLIDTEYPAVRELQSRHGFRTVLAVPLLREGESVGIIGLLRNAVHPFTPAEISLVQTFADQAVIAIENVRLFSETREALEQQTATAEVLQVISSSPSDVQPVFDAICERAMTLCDAHIGGVARFDGELVHLVAFHGTSPEATAAMLAAFPMPAGRGAITARAIAERAPVQIADVMADPDYALKDATRLAGYRSNLAVPMLREGQVVGSIGVCRKEPGTFPDKQVKLLETFADQAVIAIENVRLFNETREALERQTATAEILRVISGSPTSTEPVFEAILASGARLCEADMGLVLRYEGGIFQTVATLVPDPAFDAYLRQPITAGPGTGLGRVASTKAPVHIPDLVDDDAYRAGDPLRLRSVELGGVRTWLGVPMLREGELIGALAIYRKEVRPFVRHQIDVLSMFADQAVIAIENVRLFNETKEALERQTATAEILKVISESPTDVQPVFDVIAGRAARLTGADYGWVFRFDGELIHIVSSFGVGAEGIEATRQAYPMPASGGSATARAVREEAVVNYADVLAEKDVHDKVKAIRQQSGYRSVLAVPMRRDDRIVGVITVAGAAVGQFGDKGIDLLQTFGRQAVIAIENARLFNETKEALEQQTATAEILEVISNSVSDTQPAFDKIMDSCQRLFGTSEIGIRLVGDDGQLHLGSHRGSALESLRKHLPKPLDQTAAGLAIREQRVLHYPDVLGGSDVPELLRRVAHEADNFSIIMAPMVWKERGIGTINVVRRPPVAFSDKEMSLLKTFADQAVIAIQNARLFNETKDALERQTATAEILRVISGSPTDVHPVLVAVAERAALLCDAVHSSVLLVDGEVLRQMAVWSREPGTAGPVEGHGVPIRRGLVNGRAFIERRTVHVEDIEPLLETEYPDARANFERIGFHAALAVPMLREGQAIGTIFIWRREARRFSNEQIALVETFASQAVIAIQNARLFHEIQDKSRELEQANKHKSEFLANMSHELRTPLNAIIGFSEVLSEQMFGDVNDKQREYLLDIHSSGHHLLSLINDILDLSKIEAGRMELELTSFNLPMLLDNTTTLVRERALRQGLTLSLDVAAELGDWVADARKLKQVVINLLSNAVKFTPAGGRITLRARALEHAVEIAVVDTGVGIAPDQQALVFEEFRQAGGDYLRKAEGTGLGLALAKRFVELHGGTMRVESVPGQGSTFAFILPEPMALTGPR